ncbi:hypothetical protein AB0D11_18800 [Streptomyces monashensis]|uniref:MmyB family transcriptional regulator n=1 Tax=Streptomyces monashensis TaxID=1678012 RepID=UPI00340B983A
MPATAGRGRLTQGQVDVALHTGFGTYQKVESGALVPSARYLRQVAELFGLTPFDLQVAHASLTGTEPVPQPSDRPDSSWVQVLQGQSQMALVLDCSGSIIAVNAAAESLFNGEAPANLWHWILSPAGRQCLCAWEEEWAPYVLAEIRRAQARHPDDPGLETLRTELGCYDYLQGMEPARSGFTAVSRTMHHPRWGTGNVQYLAAQIEGSSGQMVTLPFTSA